MFGYVNVNRNELSQQDKTYYQSYYCGLCRTLKDESGLKGRFLLTYDMTFLIVLLSGLYELEDSIISETCMMHPFKKRELRMNEATEYGAKMNVLLGYSNFEDDWKDNRSIPKKIAAKMFEERKEEIAKEYPRQAKAVDCYIMKLEVAERGEEVNLDAVAGLTGDMLGEIFAWKDDEWSNELKSVGFYLGKYIYLMDAYDDREKDEENGGYNPLSYERKKRTEKDYETFVRLLLQSMMSECAKSFERMPILMHDSIIRNILYSGVWTKYDMIQFKTGRKAKKEEGRLERENKTRKTVQIKEDKKQDKK